MAEIGYCTLEDVRKALQETDVSFGDAKLSEEFVEAAITGQTEWLQETTNRHWYDPDADGDLLPTEPLTHSHDEQDIPSSPHSDNVQAFRRGRRGRARYPVRHAGPYTRTPLTRRDVADVTELLVRRQDGSYTDWVEECDEGRGADYYVQRHDHDGNSYLYLHTGTLPRLSDYGAAVVVTYEYGRDEIPQTVRRAIAFRAVADLLRDDEAALGIPDSGQLQPAESKIQAFERQAEELLEIHK